MATLQIITPEELVARQRKPKGRGRSGRRRSEARQQVIDQFKHALASAEPGYGGDLLLDEGEEKRVVRQSLKAAAEELGKALDFRPIKDKSRIHFRIITPEEKAAKPKRGGRPKKNAQVEMAPEDGSPEVPPAPSRRGRRATSEAS
jgi:hypothetical protein